jgi:hypothetical protein
MRPELVAIRGNQLEFCTHLVITWYQYAMIEEIAPLRIQLLASAMP